MPVRPPSPAAPIPPAEPPSAFARDLVHWHRRHGRHDLPWQRDRNPYHVWLSEIMLQQTQVATVIPYYERFLQRFPDIHQLAAASLDEVLALWAGLGYYSRARQAHRCAQSITRDHGGVFPATATALETLPGIGPSTAAAIAAFCHNERAAILDGNVKRVLARHAAIGAALDEAATKAQLWDLARSRLPAAAHMPAYTQAIMDLGASVCRRSHPRCHDCPVSSGCAAHALGIATDLPVRSPRRERPQRESHWLVLLDEDKVWLEKRPARGLWGGLLTLPQFTQLATLEAQLGEASSGSTLSIESLPARRHAFTHFTLHFTPHVVRAALDAPKLALPGCAPYPFEALEHLALPAPVARLIRDLCAAKPGAALC